MILICLGLLPFHFSSFAVEQSPFYHCPKIYVTIKLDSSKDPQKDLSRFKPLKFKAGILNLSGKQTSGLSRRLDSDHLTQSFPNFLQPRFSGYQSDIFLLLLLMFYLLKVDLLNRQWSLMPLMSLQMEVAGKEYKITRNRHLGNETLALTWKWRTWVQLCIPSEGRLTMEPSFLSLFATKRRVISFWLTGPEDQKTTGNLNVPLGHNNSPYHGNTSGN